MNSLNAVIIGDIATWVTAVGTVGAFYVGFLQIRKERHLRREREAREDEAKEREQAEQISAWVARRSNPSAAEIMISNQSGHPVYKMVISVVNIHDGKAANGRNVNDRHRAAIGTIPPGVSSVDINLGKTLKEYHPAVEIAFTDQYGKTWVNRYSARMRELSVLADKYYELEQPVQWQAAKHITRFGRPRDII